MEKMFKQKFIFEGIIIGIIITLCYLIICRYIEFQKEKIRINEEYTNVYVASNDIEIGKEIANDDYKLIEALKTSIPSEMIKKPDELSGKVAKININKNTMLQPEYFEDKFIYDLKMCEVIELNDLDINLDVGDVTNIRIRKQDGSDYLIVYDKKIYKRDKNRIWINIDENEKIEIEKAMAERVNGAIIYGAK